jgi:hypothetical protein
MSLDFAFWHSDEPLEDDEAGRIYQSLVERGSSESMRPSAKIAALAKEIRDRWPPPASGKEDDWPLAAPPEVSDSYLIAYLVRSRSWDAWPVLGQLAEQLELVMYDPQQEHVFLPRPLSRKRTRMRARQKGDKPR